MNVFPIKRIALLLLLVLGFVAFVPQQAKAGGYFGISIGPSYCDPYPGYYEGYYPRYYRGYHPQYYRRDYYYDRPDGYLYWRYQHHRHNWHEDDDD
ncbi:MAG: hypothetical protein JO076_16025 [Verrucomicrobia bacterium]|nr:hypothetical protein [Verrucomicrobiota bacterium]